jgi:hypothetical protein
MRDSILDRFLYSGRPMWMMLRVLALIGPPLLGIFVALPLYLAAWRP